jgi:hypothetical protein
MKLGELFVEPVLIGFAALLALVLLLAPDLEPGLRTIELENAAIALTAAYFCGIVFDRLADTILSRLEHHHRLQFALEHPDPRPGWDPFPEDEYHIALMASPEAWEHAYYLKSRIRLTRGLLVLAPALGVAATVRAVQAGPSLRMAVAIAVIAIYAVCIWLRAGEPRDDAKKLPRTTALRDADERKKYQEASGPPDSLVSFIFWNEPLAWGVPMIAAIAIVVGLGRGHLMIALAFAAAIVGLCGLLAWCWWRITTTFFTFERNYTVLGRDRRVAANS